VIDACAFMLWNLASRSPGQLARDLSGGLTRPGIAIRGLTRTLGGLVLLAAGALIIEPTAIGSRTYVVLETWTILTGLLVEQLVGPDLRSRRN